MVTPRWMRLLCWLCERVEAAVERAVVVGCLVWGARLRRLVYSESCCAENTVETHSHRQLMGFAEGAACGTTRKLSRCN